MLMTDDLAQRIANDFKGQKLDGYTIEGLHAKGGTSVVLVGSNGHKQAAIKIYAQELFQKSDAEKERIERQVEKRHLIHPNLVKTYCAGVHLGYHYLTMEFVEAPTLEEVVQDLPREKIRTVIQQIAAAALFMHADMQQVHRDIKPANVAVRLEDFNVTLLDLGLVRPVSGATITDQGSVHIRGTKEYAPPELLDNLVQLDEQGWLAVTFYQLGATLYEMLTLKPPFAELQGDALLRAIREVPPNIDFTDAPADLVKLSLDCMHKDPRQRLSLVNWERFLNTPIVGDQLSQLEELLGALHRTDTTILNFPKGAELQHRLKRTFTELAHEVELAIRSFMSGKELVFPNYTIARREDLESDTTSILVVEIEYGAPQKPISVCSVISTEITDASSRSCVCSLSTSVGQPLSRTDKRQFRSFYEGVFVLEQFSLSVREELARDLMQILRHTNE
ncbi:MAG TPA: hypothetical protein DDZ51_06585 [Planctomycetaceae bacterium]|nr:hypothetical protein [Planctomycetaceae bacterium]